MGRQGVSCWPILLHHSPQGSKFCYGEPRKENHMEHFYKQAQTARNTAHANQTDHGPKPYAVNIARGHSGIRTSARLYGRDAIYR